MICRGGSGEGEPRLEESKGIALRCAGHTWLLFTAWAVRQASAGLLEALLCREEAWWRCPAPTWLTHH